MLGKANGFDGAAPVTGQGIAMAFAGGALTGGILNVGGKFFRKVVKEVPVDEFVDSVPLETLFRSASKKVDTSDFTNALKGELGELRTSLNLRRAGLDELPTKIGPNNGFDHVAVSKNLQDIFIIESKFSKSGKLILGNTRHMDKQMSNQWIGKNIKKMLQSGDPNLIKTANLLLKNKGKIKFRAAVLTPNGRLKFILLTPK